MAAPASKKAKIVRTDSDVESLGSPPSKKGRYCVICGGEATAKIEKNANYDSMMQLYWCTLGVDVKPETCNKSDLCADCFDKVVNFFETNDIIVYFETYFKSLRLELLKKTLKGIKVLDKAGHTLTKVHNDIKKKYGDGPDITPAEEEQIRHTLNSYNMESSFKDDDTRVVKLGVKKPDSEGVAKKKSLNKTANSESENGDTSGSEEESDD